MRKRKRCPKSSVKRSERKKRVRKSTEERGKRLDSARGGAFEDKAEEKH